MSSGSYSFVPPFSHAEHKTLEEVANDTGVSPSRLESQIKHVMAEFCEETAKSFSWNYSRDTEGFMDELYNLYVLSGQSPLAAPWLKHMQSLDAFVAHFCPQANKNTLSMLYSNVTHQSVI